MITSLCALLLLQSAPLTPGKVFDVPGGGSFDYMACDNKTRRIFATHGSSKTLTVLDLNSGMVSEVAVGAVNGVQIDNKLNKIFLTGKGQTLVALNRDTLAKEGEISFDGPGDDLVIDTKRQEIYVCHDDGTNDWVVDASTLKIVGTVSIDGAPEYVLYNSTTDKIYQNIKSPSEIQVIDPETKKVVATWPTAPEESAHGLVVDRRAGRAYSAGSNGKLCAFDLISGKVIASVDIKPGTDQIAWDASKKRIYCASRGFISVVQITEDGAKSLGDVPSPAGAHTIAVDPTTHDVYVVYGGASAHIQQFTTAE